ncbi:hypothetical protein E7Z59_11685 [Robertkochia marina]|uniref:Uncharacterized protein n=1 Tax=Robertkochia marina TaxID=1227945 RepID=A0A4S3LZ75_9FLAO|nr:hypothetical protein [Robertkochia marina]THD66461.1 hypothetical protein E7Z59_11685 [Robertkochia marina]TRZ44138.1 hypothetical protein D3A96_09495 [Robertkochia marina]
MKTLQFILSALTLVCLLSCTNDLSESILEENTINIESKNSSMDLLGSNPGMAYEISRLRKSMGGINTISDAFNAGYQNLVTSDFNPSGYFNGMGYHLLNPAFVDGTFDAANPEALMIFCDGKGNYEVVGVEYIVVGISPLDCPDGEDCAPEGFPGASDVWSWNEVFNVWTLHAWVKWNNPDGFFNAMNPEIGPEESCGIPPLLAEINSLNKSLEGIITKEDAEEAGWNIPLTPYIPGMGYHLGNGAYLGDGEFNVNEPEALLLACNEEGDYVVVGAEYIVDMANMEKPNKPPQGYTGDADHWEIVGGNLWTLHAWIRIPNSEGFFNPTNSQIPNTDPCGGI